MLKRFSFAWCALLLAIPAAQAQTKEYPFVTQVKQHFTKWDRDQNGLLSIEEIEKTLVSRKVVEQEAAAIAALHQAARGKKYDLPALTIDNIVKLVPHPKGDKKLPDLQTMYNGALSRIKNTKRDLFTGKEIKLDDLHQGRLGDCYCLAPLGCILNRDADAVKNMFTQDADGKVRVKFPSGKSVLVNPLSDGEIAVMATTTNEGTWLNSYEKAIGIYRLVLAKKADEANAKKTPPKSDPVKSPDPANPTKTPEVKTKPLPVTSLGAVGNGGQASQVIELITGRRSERVSLKPLQSDKTDAAKRDALLAELRKKLDGALAAQRIVCLSTPAESTTPTPGLTLRHAYGVFGYKKATDEVVIWNPHGNTFKPKGTPGIEHGYPTSKGLFVMPLKDAVRTFSAFTIETAEPANAAKK